jgi:hypothetical protein
MNKNPYTHNFKIMRIHNQFSGEISIMHASGKKLVFSTTFINTTMPQLTFNLTKYNLSIQPLHTLSHDHHYSHLLPPIVHKSFHHNDVLWEDYKEHMTNNTTPQSIGDLEAYTNTTMASRSKGKGWEFKFSM